MEQRLATYAKRYQLPAPAVQELVTLIRDMIQESITRGAPVLEPLRDEDWNHDTVIPQSAEDAADMLPDLVRSLSPSKRYEDLGYLGVGSMGEVRQVRDRHLKRVVAMKVMRAELTEDFSLLARFIEEAQATAQLQHPGIVPLHDLGQFEDGRYYFTMKEVKGNTISHVVEMLHQQSRYQGRWVKTHEGWTFRRLVTAFREVCEAVGYAHSRGVLHRDIKPENVMLGAYGEVLVVDWGLVKVQDMGPGASGPNMEEAVDTVRAKEQRFATKVGTLTGTPMYMSPEQAQGDQDIDTRSDVYALGALLYEIMSGRPPYIADSWQQVMELLLEGPPPPLIMSQEQLQAIWAVNPYFRAPLPVPEDLANICMRAMARAPEDRYQDAEAMALAIDEWLEGEQKREDAEALVGEANVLQAEVTQLQSKLAELHSQVDVAAERLEPWASDDEKKPLWALEDEAGAVELEAERKAQEVELLLQEALVHDPQMLEARIALARSCQAHHQAAEAQGRDHERVRAEQMLHKQLSAIPASHETHSEFSAYLEGGGKLTLRTEPPGVDLRVYQYNEHNRRLMPVSGQPFGQTPLDGEPLSMGRYMLLLHKAGYEEVRYPVWIRRQEHWDGCAPGTDEPLTLRLMTKGALFPDDCYIPPGYFMVGGDLDAANSLQSQRLWLDGFVIKQHPVTLLQYMKFLNYLWAEGRLDEAMRYAPRTPSTEEGDPMGALVFFAFDEARGFVRSSADGIGVSLDWPVTYIDYVCAQAFTDWYSAAKGQRWILPDELAWEKAARGVDGRLLPWGDWMNPSWCCMIDSRPDFPAIDVVDSWPIDKSVFNVRGIAGNVGDWCGNPFRPDGPRSWETKAKGLPHERDAGREEHASGGPLDETSLYTVRGGAWNEGPSFSSCASRYGALAFGRYNNIGFRLMRWL